MQYNRYECGCERGGDCTKTTMCAVQSALEDLQEQHNVQLRKVYELVRLGCNQAANAVLERLLEDE